MIIGLVVILALVLILPFVFKSIEHNLEYFLFASGLLASVVSGTLSTDLLLHIFQNKLLYFITGAVLIAGLIFSYSIHRIKWFVETSLKYIPLKIFVLILIIVLGLISSFITAIVAALILVEVIHVLSLRHGTTVKITVTACLSIGLGAALTPIGEPLSTIVVSALNADFWYLFNLIGLYVIPGIIVLGLVGMLIIQDDENKQKSASDIAVQDISDTPRESISTVFLRAFKIFIFVLALELLGAGFRPLINTYIIHLDSRILYWINMISAVLDNATLAAAEISSKMSVMQIKSILMGLLVSGGMLIPGNIPNIISAGKLNIKSREWAAFGIPACLILLSVYFLIIFFI